MLVRNSGIAEADIIFIEISLKHDWAFDLSTTSNDKYYFPHTHQPAEELDYTKFWEFQNNIKWPGDEVCALTEAMKKKLEPHKDPPPAATTCNKCKASIHKNNPMRCTECKVKYCSLKCLRLDAEEHKKTCGKSSEEKSKESTSNKKKMSVLQNLGNSCYINSTVQCLKHTSQLLQYIISGNYKKDIHSKSSEVISRFAELICELNEFNKCSLPYEFKKACEQKNSQFKGNSQSDAQEFLCFLIDCLNDDLKKSEDQSFIMDLFRSYFKSTIRCTICGNRSTKLEPYIFWSLPIDKCRELTVIYSTESGHIYKIECGNYEGLSVKEFKERVHKELLLKNSILIKMNETGNMCLLEDGMIFSDFYRAPFPILLGCESSDCILTIFEKVNKFCVLMPSVLTLKQNIIKIFELYADKKLEEKDLFVDEPLYSDDVKLMEDAKPPADGSLYKKVVFKSPTYELSEILSFLPKRKISEYTNEPNNIQYFISRFVKEEKLDGENKLMCEHCKASTPIYKNIEFSQFGKTLIIHLKRFKIISADKREKIDTNVDFPLEMTLNSDQSKQVNFRLYAVLNHIGSMESGHYTAYCRDLLDMDKWREFDDNRVKDVSKIQSDKAYVLFYECIS